MTPAEFRAVRERLGLTQVALAEALGITATSVARKERGEQEIVERDVLALRALAVKAHKAVLNTRRMARPADD